MFSGKSDFYQSQRNLNLGFLGVLLAHLGVFIFIHWQ